MEQRREIRGSAINGNIGPVSGVLVINCDTQALTLELFSPIDGLGNILFEISKQILLV